MNIRTLKNSNNFFFVQSDHFFHSVNVSSSFFSLHEYRTLMYTVEMVDLANTVGVVQERKKKESIDRPFTLFGNMVAN